LRPSGGIKNESTIVKVTVQTNSGMEERTAAINIVSGGKAVKTVALTQSFVKKAISTASSFTFGAQESTGTFTVTSNADWTLESSESWLTVSPVKGGKGDTEVTVKAAANDGESTRNATLTLSCGETSSKIEVSQLSDEVVAPEGYSLVWSDEFNEGSVPGKDWVHENWAAGHVNNELQTYTDKEIDGKRTTEIKDGFQPAAKTIKENLSPRAV